MGRKEQLRDGMTSLTNSGSFLAIYGLRGVGKSSIAHQLRLIAEGNTTLPKTLALDKYIPKKGFKFLTQYVTCDLSTKTTLDLLKRIVFGEAAGGSLFDRTKAGDRRLKEMKEILEGEVGANLFGSKLGTKGARETTYGSYVSDDFIQQFKQLMSTIRRDNQEHSGLFIIIDEFDTFRDKPDFASIIKTVSSEYVKFCVVGIANSVTELIEGHSSIARQIESVEVGRMPDYELSEILARAEFHVDRAITYDSSAKEELVKQSEGFPYFTHLLGRESMLIAFGRDASLVDGTVITELSEKITNGRLRTIYEDIYHRAVKSSPQRELLLKIFAEHSSDEIPTEEVYATAKSLEISNPSQLMKELTTPITGREPVLVKVRDRYYRFSDPVFKVYSRIRQWKY